MNEQAARAHDACIRARHAAWAMRKAMKQDNPEAWRDLCDAIAEATDAAGKAMDMTAGSVEPEIVDAEEARELLRETTWQN